MEIMCVFQLPIRQGVVTPSEFSYWLLFPVCDTALRIARNEPNSRQVWINLTGLPHELVSLMQCFQCCHFERMGENPAFSSHRTDIGQQEVRSKPPGSHVPSHHPVTIANQQDGPVTIANKQDGPVTIPNKQFDQRPSITDRTRVLVQPSPTGKYFFISFPCSTSSHRAFFRLFALF